MSISSYPTYFRGSSNSSRLLTKPVKNSGDDIYYGVGTEALQKWLVSPRLEIVSSPGQKILPPKEEKITYLSEQTPPTQEILNSEREVQALKQRLLLNRNVQRRRAYSSPDLRYLSKTSLHRSRSRDALLGSDGDGHSLHAPVSSSGATNSDVTSGQNRLFVRDIKSQKAPSQVEEKEASNKNRAWQLDTADERFRDNIQASSEHSDDLSL